MESNYFDKAMAQLFADIDKEREQGEGAIQLLCQLKGAMSAWIEWLNNPNDTQAKTWVAGRMADYSRQIDDLLKGAH